MRKSNLALYAPFLAVVLIQALFVAFLPSTPGDGEDLAAGGPLGAEGSEVGGAVFDPETGQYIDPTTGEAVAGGGGGAGGAGATATGGRSGGGGGGAGGGGADGGGARAQGDTSHCTKDGRQHGITYHAPPCVPKWPDGADNGGATYQGVTKDKVKIVVFSSEPNAAVNAVLAPQGLAQTEEQTQAMHEAAVKFINKHYETYGRQFEFVRVEGACPTTPPDVDSCLAAAREVVKMKPFLVQWATPLYDVVFDEWARAGIPSIGGWHFEDSFFTKRRPYRYDVFMDGTQSAQHIAEYYCKKMAKQGASHSGQVIHPSIGPRGTPRRLGISTPDLDANVAAARVVQSLVSKCDTRPPVITTYQSDIERAEEQAQATTQAYIEADVTTVVCMCDPIAPAFGTNAFSRQGYYPENLLPGLGLLDYDKVGRLYDPQQRQHMFGPSHLNNPLPFPEQDQSKVWRDSGMSGEPCQSCGLNWVYYGFSGGLLQMAGPNLNPLTLERGALSQQPRGGWKQTQDPTKVLYKMGPNDYTALSDVREVYWNDAYRSPIDGQPGGYVPVNGGRRYELGEWPGGGLQGIPVAPN